VRERACELRDGERCGGEQRKTKHLHDNLRSWKKIDNKLKSLLGEGVDAAINCQPLGRIVATGQQQS
jgi:hypothetical protein